MGWRERVARLGELVNEFYEVRHRGALARERRQEDDLFMLLVFSEMMGIENPASYYTLELPAAVLRALPRVARADGDGALAARELPLLLSAGPGRNGSAP